MSQTAASGEAALTVNGRSVQLAAAPRTPLVFVLRNELGLTGVRTGCGIGECGVCTVSVDGEAVRSCAVSLADVVGCRITTPEGLGTPDAPGPIQQAFIDEQAAQCGYCINGMIMRTHVELTCGASAAQAITALDDHLCRCGTHARIRRAINRAAGEPPGPAAWRVIRPVPVERRQRPAAGTGAGDLVSDRLRGRPDGRVEVLLGKVELGQGIRTAMAQVAAAAAGLRLEDLVLVDVVTDLSPDEGLTAASRSLMQGGVAMARAGVALRRLLLRRAAGRLGCDPADLDLGDGRIQRAGADPDAPLPTLADLLADGPLDEPVLDTDEPGWTGAPLGLAAPRSDLPSTVTGAPAYVQDLQLPGMVHARTVLPPGQHARLVAVDDDAMVGTPGLLDVVCDGDLLIAVAEEEAQAVVAARRLAQAATWDDPGLDLQTADIEQELRRRPTHPHVEHEAPGIAGVLAAHPAHRATYTTPYQLHAAVAPSCAVARWDAAAATLEIWTHSQGPYLLRAELATLLDLPPAHVVVRHSRSAGCYGHNLADDAAAVAAVAARAVPGRWVRLAFTVEEEFTWEPQSSAMVVDLQAAVDADGRLQAWQHRTITDTHIARPVGTGDRLLPAWLLAGTGSRRWPGPHAGGARNGVPLYDRPHLEVVADHVEGPVRTSALRTLGAFANAFASESFVDEVAERAGRDPLAFRLDHLRDPRARTVLQAAADAAGWRPRVGPTGGGQGLALTRYKGEAAFVAVVVDCRVDPEGGAITVDRVVVACDAGVVVNPAGLASQLEGGVLQALSRTLLEAVSLDGRGQRTRDWTTYPVIGMASVPAIEILLLDRPGEPPLGVGEAATPPVPAAVANAVDDATGIRLRSLPFTPDRVEARLLAMDAEEAARVIA